jgi:L-histidine Nalpha-methyltransferase
MSLTHEPVYIESYLNGSNDDSMAWEIQRGLSQSPKELPPKYLYDERGSELFDQITTLPEYYPTRCERAILNRNAANIVAIGNTHELVELGSGSASKTRALLFAMAAAGTLRRYVPVDVAEGFVRRCADNLAAEFPGLSIHGLVGDFEQHLAYIPSASQRLFAFLGGTIGNLYPAERLQMLSSLRELLSSSDYLLLGCDLVKDKSRLEAAYNDSAGVTAAFNRNVLHAINAALDSDFEPEAFEHVAFFDNETSRVEMRLRSSRAQQVHIPGASIEVSFEPGEEVRTEISTKFTEEQIRTELSDAGLRLEAFFTDTDRQFALSLAAPD